MQYIVRFSESFPEFQTQIQTNTLLNISSFSDRDFNYSFQFQNSSSSFSLNLKTSKPFVNGPMLSFTLNISDYFLEENHISLYSKANKIKLLEYYPISDSAIQAAASISSQNQKSETLAVGVGYSASFFTSSAAFSHGLMTMEMMYLLKFVNLNYPPLVVQMFESKQSNSIMPLDLTIIEDPADSHIMPQLFRKYKVSAYFLNNTGEIIYQLIVFIFIAFFLLAITPYNSNERKIGFIMKLMVFLRDALVWELVLFYLFMNLQKIAFFVVCSLIFPPTNSIYGKLNLLVASVVGFLLFVWFCHLYIKISVCQKLKETPPDNFGSNPKFLTYNSAQVNDSPLPLVVKKLKPLKELKYPSRFKKDVVFPEAIEQQIIKSQPTFCENSASKNDEIEGVTPSIGSGCSMESKSQNNNNNTTKNNNFLWRFLFQPKENEVYLQRYNFLHRNYKPINLLSQYYGFLYYSRQISLGIIAALMHDYPFEQVILMITVNISFFIYTIFSTPFTSGYSYVVSVVNELITVTTFFNALLIALYDYEKNSDFNTRMNFGWIIIMGKLVLLYWILGTGFGKPIYLGVVSVCKKRKSRSQIHAFSDQQE